MTVDARVHAGSVSVAGGFNDLDVTFGDVDPAKRQLQSGCRLDGL